ncbi:hypothetical protein SB776_41125, partial [Burkholderia sp. SIMBA_045]
LIPQLTYHLQTMRDNGRMKALREQYGVTLETPIQPIKRPEQLTVVGAIHQGLLNANGTGELWNLAKSVFPTFTPRLNT